jgi:hypothetical protein
VTYYAQEHVADCKSQETHAPTSSTAALKYYYRVSGPGGAFGDSESAGLICSCPVPMVLQESTQQGGKLKVKD